MDEVLVTKVTCPFVFKESLNQGQMDRVIFLCYFFLELSNHIVSKRPHHQNNIRNICSCQENNKILLIIFIVLKNA